MTVLIQKWFRDTIEETHGSVGPFIDADGSMSGNFGSSGEHLKKAIEDMTERLCQDNTVKHLEAFLACKLILLGNQPGVRPIEIGEVLRRVI